MADIQKQNELLQREVARLKREAALQKQNEALQKEIAQLKRASLQGKPIVAGPHGLMLVPHKTEHALTRTVPSLDRKQDPKKACSR